MKGASHPVQDILDNAEAEASSEEIATEIYDLDLELVRRILRFAYQRKVTLIIGPAEPPFSLMTLEIRGRLNTLTRRLLALIHPEGQTHRHRHRKPVWPPAAAMTETPAITPQEIRRRREAYRQALACNRIAGIEHDPATDPISRRGSRRDRQRPGDCAHQGVAAVADAAALVCEIQEKRHKSQYAHSGKRF